MLAGKLTLLRRTCSDVASAPGLSTAVQEHTHLIIYYFEAKVDDGLLRRNKGLTVDGDRKLRG